MPLEFSALVAPADWDSLTTMLKPIQEGLRSAERRPILNVGVAVPSPLSWTVVANHSTTAKRLSPISEDAALYFLRGRVTRVLIDKARKLQTPSHASQGARRASGIAVDCGIRVVLLGDSRSFEAMHVRMGAWVEGVGVLVAHLLLWDDEMRFRDRVRVIGISEFPPVEIGAISQTFRLVKFEAATQASS